MYIYFPIYIFIYICFPKVVLSTLWNFYQQHCLELDNLKLSLLLREKEV